MHVYAGTSVRRAGRRRVQVYPWLRRIRFVTRQEVGCKAWIGSAWGRFSSQPRIDSEETAKRRNAEKAADEEEIIDKEEKLVAYCVAGRRNAGGASGVGGRRDG